MGTANSSKVNTSHHCLHLHNSTLFTEFGQELRTMLRELKPLRGHVLRPRDRVGPFAQALPTVIQPQGCLNPGLVLGNPVHCQGQHAHQAGSFADALRHSELRQVFWTPQGGAQSQMSVHSGANLNLWRKRPPSERLPKNIPKPQSIT